ncbi:MurR/RpiR family transcriptional regulator [Vagococcus vulneris]|uniref:RpiR family transcriptional regulator n=1 Tax=Vagococcus vulneris TaxID=1977869 RepID=A0A429ZZ98_9ENTE|nr:MurR/RpiR family transcriptional regulator [Vagococcus vulneris]RST99335.1 hypothetical protein CBF37_05030 [Vagococcus vulneris]
MDNQSIIYKIRERIDELPKAEKKLAKWIVRNPKKVPKMTVKELSEESLTSPATVVRLCYSLGLEGFTDLKLRVLKEDNKTLDQALYTDIVPNEAISIVQRKLKYTLNNAFEETVTLLDDNEVQKAVDLLAKSKSIYSYGIGASGLAAEDLYQKLTRVGKSILYSRDNHLLTTAIASNTQSKVLVAISNSGEKKEVIDLIKAAKKFNVCVICVTSEVKSTVANLSDIILLTASGIEAPIRSSATNSLMVQLFVIDTLFSSYASKHYESVVNNLNISKKAISDFYKE